MSQDTLKQNDASFSTPSRVDQDTPAWVRVVGLAGKAAFILGLLMYLWNAWVYLSPVKAATEGAGLTTEPSSRIYPLAIPLFVLGIIIMLYHASRERDHIQRRIMGILGIVFFCLGVLFATQLLASEAIKNWLMTYPEPSLETANSRGKWGGLIVTIIMALVLFKAWIAPFIRAAAGYRVSLLGLSASWVKYLGKPLVAANTLYGVVFLTLLVAIAFLLKDPLLAYSDTVLKYSEDNRVAYGLGSYALLFMMVGLPFMLVMANTEAEESPWGRVPTSIIGLVGIVAALIGLLGFCTDLLKIPDFTLPYGFTLSILGLFLISLYISQRNNYSESGHILARWTGYAGLMVCVIAALRSLLPSITEITWLQDTFESLENLNLKAYLVPNGFLYMLLGGLYCFVGFLFCSERKLMILTRRELASFFTSPIGYIVLGATLVVAWFVYSNWVDELVMATNMGAAFPEPVVAPYFFDMWIIIFMLIAIPMMTMRVMSEENRAGTMEILMTAPVDEFSIVVSKFLAAWLYTIMIFMTWAIYPLLLRIAGQEAFDFRPMMSSLLGLCIVSFGFVAMGVFFSSITKNQIVALLLTFAGMLAIFMLYFVEQTLSRNPKADPNSPLFEFLRYISFVHHVFLSFARGKVEFKHILFHLSFGAFWLFLTIRVLESRKWR
ncbi:MAG: ABC transporter permease [Planctomycetia bacterium]|nr:ABC transporter permease [Planctomycetia bacterium]